jgi:Mn-dependent DtxR family transcriptional regulator
MKTIFSILQNNGILVLQKRRMAAVLELCCSKGSIVRSDIEMALSVFQPTVTLLLRELELIKIRK